MANLAQDSLAMLATPTLCCHYILFLQSSIAAISMADLSDSEPHAVSIGLLGIGTIVAHHRPGRDPGRAFFWEPRYWLQYFGIANTKDYNKDAKRRGYWQQLLREWELEPERVSHPQDTEQGLRTTAMDSTALLAWIFSKFRHFELAHNAPRAVLAMHALQDYERVAGEASRACQGAGLQVRGKEIIVDEFGKMFIGPLLELHANIAEEWSTLLLAGGACGLTPLPDDLRVSACQLLIFLEARIWHSQVRPSHNRWIKKLRNQLLLLVAFKLEIATGHHLEATQGQQNVHPTDLWGPSGKKRCRRSTLSKFNWFEKMMKRTGSNEAILAAMQEHKGMASEVGNVLTYMDREVQRKIMLNATAAALSWDEATYGGSSYNVGFVININNGQAAYLKPVVRASVVCVWFFSGLVGAIRGERLVTDCVSYSRRAGIIKTDWLDFVYQFPPGRSLFS